jgi:hypothetical protein
MTGHTHRLQPSTQATQGGPRRRLTCSNKSSSVIPPDMLVLTRWRMGFLHSSRQLLLCPSFKDRPRLRGFMLLGANAPVGDESPGLRAQDIRVDRVAVRRGQPRERMADMRHGGRVVHPSDADDAHGRDTERARLAGCVELAAGEIEASQSPTRVADRFDLAVGLAITLAALSLAMTFRSAHAVATRGCTRSARM